MNYCGTPRGLNEHRKANTPPCKWCLLAAERAEHMAAKPDWEIPWFAYIPLPGRPGPKPFIGPRLPKVKPKSKRPAGRPRITGRPPCGTETAYRWEKKNLGQGCPECKAVVNAAQAERYRRRKERYANTNLPDRLPNGAKHGTQRGWQGCHLRPEGACEPCVTANEQKKRSERARRAAKKETTP